MPRYEYRCTHCQKVTLLRRAVDEMDDPIECLSDGAEMERLFSTTDNIFVPLHFQNVRRGGLAGGYSWSDFHDKSEVEMARTADKDVEIRHINEARSRPRRVESRKDSIERGMEKAFDRAMAKVGPAPEGTWE